MLPSRAQLPRQHLRLQDARASSASGLGVSAVGSMKLEYKPTAHRGPRPVLRPHAAPARHLLRQRPGGARLGGAGRSARSCSPVFVARRREPPAPPCTRAACYLCMEGPQFSTRAESEVYRALGRRRHRHDQPAGGEARARGRDLLRHAGDGHRLRLLARGGGDVSGEAVMEVIAQNVRDGADGGAQRRCAGSPACRASCACQRRAAARADHRPRAGAGADLARTCSRSSASTFRPAAADGDAASAHPGHQRRRHLLRGHQAARPGARRRSARWWWWRPTASRAPAATR